MKLSIDRRPLACLLWIEDLWEASIDGRPLGGILRIEDL